MAADMPSTLDINLSWDKPKIKLHDGTRDVKTLTVVSMLRDCEVYARYLTKILDAFEARYECSFEYYFLENDSKDGTNEVLSKWIENHEGSVMVYKLKEDYTRTSHGIDHRRIRTLADLRNKAMNAIAPLESEWCLFIDSNIYVDPCVLQDLFETKPAEKGYAMLGGYTNRMFSMDILKPEVREKFNLDGSANKMVSVAHYADVNALVDHEYKMHPPLCPFEKCNLCTNQRMGANRTRYPKDQDIVDVRACWGGFVIVDSAALSHETVRWDSISYETKMDLSMSEHVLFCERLRAVTGKKIGIAQHVDKIFKPM